MNLPKKYQIKVYFFYLVLFSYAHVLDLLHATFFSTSDVSAIYYNIFNPILSLLTM